jgi:hypothetical protein
LEKKGELKYMEEKYLDENHEIKSEADFSWRYYAGGRAMSVVKIFFALMLAPGSLLSP